MMRILALMCFLVMANADAGNNATCGNVNCTDNQNCTNVSASLCSNKTAGVDTTDKTAVDEGANNTSHSSPAPKPTDAADHGENNTSHSSPAPKPTDAADHGDNNTSHSSPTPSSSSAGDHKEADGDSSNTTDAPSTSTGSDKSNSPAKDNAADSDNSANGGSTDKGNGNNTALTDKPTTNDVSSTCGVGGSQFQTTCPTPLVMKTKLVTCSGACTQEQCCESHLTAVSNLPAAEREAVEKQMEAAKNEATAAHGMAQSAMIMSSETLNAVKDGLAKLSVQGVVFAAADVTTAAEKGKPAKISGITVDGGCDNTALADVVAKHCAEMIAKATNVSSSHLTGNCTGAPSTRRLEEAGVALRRLTTPTDFEVGATSIEKMIQQYQAKVVSSFLKKKSEEAQDQNNKVVVNKAAGAPRVAAALVAIYMSALFA